MDKKRLLFYAVIAIVAMLMPNSARADKQAWVAYYEEESEVDLITSETHNYLVFSYGESPAATYNGIPLKGEEYTWSGLQVTNWMEADSEATRPEWGEIVGGTAASDFPMDAPLGSFVMGTVTDVVFDQSFLFVRPTCCACWFMGYIHCPGWTDPIRIDATTSNLRSIEGLEFLNTSKVTNMHHMFHGCYKLRGSIDVSTFDMQNVTKADGMFRGTGLTEIIGLESWNTQNVRHIGSMFEYSLFLKNVDLSNWDLSNCTYAGWMFSACRDLETIDLSSINLNDANKTRADAIEGSLNYTNCSLKELVLPVGYSPSRSFIHSNLLGHPSVSLSITDVTSFLTDETSAQSFFYRMLYGHEGDPQTIKVPDGTPQAQIEKLNELLAAAAAQLIAKGRNVVEGNVETSSEVPAAPEYFNLTVSDACLSTLCLPYNAKMPTADYFNAAIVTNVKAVVKGTTREYVATMKTLKNGIIPANTGVVIMANPGTYRLEATEETTTEKLTANMLGGCVVKTPVANLKNDPTDKYYVFAQGTLSPAGLKLSSSAKNCAANKAYMVVPADYFKDGSEAKFIGLSFVSENEEDATAIEQFKANTAAAKEYYNLSGQRVEKPTRGICIVNGKKVLVK